MSRAFNTTALISALLLAVAVALIVSSFRKSSHEPLVSLSPTFHVTATDARLAFFNTRRGPYRGSVLFLDFIDAGVQIAAFGNSMGIYYRHIRWPTGEVIWSLMVSLWYPTVLLSVLPAIWVLRHIRIRSGEAREPSDVSADPVHPMPEKFRTAS